LTDRQEKEERSSDIIKILSDNICCSRIIESFCGAYIRTLPGIKIKAIQAALNKF